uniref:Uncharacterized protein n=1 Tax=Timema bartmani TaxID=61472 RepID=A0A7R9I5Z7_9NEOP|nr:unnamed protein product [Timema bartmani]
MNHTSLLSEMTSPITLIKSEDICRPELTPLQPLDPHSICSLIPQSMTVAWDDDYYAPHDKTTSQHSGVGAADQMEEDSSQNGWGSTPSPRYSSNHGADADVSIILDTAQWGARSPSPETSPFIAYMGFGG